MTLNVHVQTTPVHRPSRRLLFTLLCLFCFGAQVSRVIAAEAPARAAASIPLSQDEATQLLDTLQDPEKRARFIATLESMVRSMPAEPATKTPATAQPAPSPVTATPQAVASQWLKIAAEHVQAASAELAHDFRSMTDLPVLTRWIRTRLSSAAERDVFLDGSWRIAVTVLVTIIVHHGMRWLIRRRFPHASLSAVGPQSSATRLGHVLRRLMLKFGSLIVAVIVGNLLVLFLLADFPVARTVAFGLTNAYLGLQALFEIIDESLRTDSQTPTDVAAHSGMSGNAKVLLVILVAAVTLEFIAGDILGELGAAGAVTESVQKLLALAAHVVLILMVISSRARVAGWMRRQARAGTSLAAILDAVAGVWASIAIIIIAGSWLVWAMDIPDTYRLIVRFIVATICVLLVSRFVGALLLKAFDRRLGELSTGSRNTFSGRLAGYHGSARAILRVVIVVLTFIALTEAWGVESIAWFGSGHAGHRFATFLLQLLLLSIIGVSCWEAADLAFEKRVTVLMDAASTARATRLRTLQPIIRLALMIVIALTVIMTVLSAVGINVGPLFAGASILGVALGFGSQKLVQDFITGIFLLVEDAIDVGDSVTVAGLSGTVEHISIRTIRLRAGDGSVYLIPFSAVTSVTNTNRGLGNAAVGVNLDPREDTDRVSAILIDIARQMRQEPAYAGLMLADLDLWGVDKVDGSMVTIAGQIACTDAGRWPVQREFNRRLKQRFEQEEILFGVPQQRVRVAGTARLPTAIQDPNAIHGDDATPKPAVP